MFALGPVIGSVRRGVVHVLVQTTSITTVTITVEGDDYDRTKKMLSTPDHPTVFKIEDIRMNRDYSICIETDNDVREGSFTTRSGPIHAMSCNKMDRLGTLAHVTCTRPSLCLHIGDQVYSDYGNSTYKEATKKKTYEEMVMVYRKMYIDAWSAPLMQEILSTRCNAMIMDDHDIVDSWDQHIRLPDSWSSIVIGGGWHALASIYMSRKEKAIIAGLQAYTEYQLSLAGLLVPGSYTLTLGEKDILLVDVRTARASRSDILDIDEYRQFDIIVSPIPVFLLPVIALNRVSAWMLRRLGIPDASDIWNIYPRHLDQMISIIKVGNPLLICGDAHMCGHSVIGGQVQQYTTSSITTTPAPRILKVIVRLFKKYRIRRTSVEHLHWTRHNNYLVIPVEGSPYFIIPDA